MNELEIMGVQELDARAKCGTNGGSIAVAIAVAIVAAAAYAAANFVKDVIINQEPYDPVNW